MKNIRNIHHLNRHNKYYCPFQPNEALKVIHYPRKKMKITRVKLEFKSGSSTCSVCLTLKIRTKEDFIDMELL